MKTLIFGISFVFVLSACNKAPKNKNKMENNSNTTIVKENVEPTIKVVDTDFSKGRLGLEHELNLEDLEKFHGHLCDGLVVGFLGLKEGLNELYPNGIVDRTNTRIVSKGSPCLTDAAVYLTGGRYQFNSFYVSNDIDGFM